MICPSRPVTASPNTYPFGQIIGNILFSFACIPSVAGGTKFNVSVIIAGVCLPAIVSKSPIRGCVLEDGPERAGQKSPGREPRGLIKL